MTYQELLQVSVDGTFKNYHHSEFLTEFACVNQENVHPFTPRIFAAYRLLPAEVAPAEVTTFASLVQLWTTNLAPYLSVCNNPVSVQLCRISSELLGCWGFSPEEGPPDPSFLCVCHFFIPSTTHRVQVPGATRRTQQVSVGGFKVSGSFLQTGLESSITKRSCSTKTDLGFCYLPSTGHLC